MTFTRSSGSPLAGRAHRFAGGLRYPKHSFKAVSDVKTMITGGAGFIGSHLVDALLQRGHDVCVLDNFSTGDESNLSAALREGAVVVRGDVRESEQVAEAVVSFQPEVIFHLAAQMNVRDSVADPAFDARTNIEGTINVLEAARPLAARVLNISTGGAMYGDTDIVPTPESVEPLPEAPYGQSKYCAERYVALYARLFGLRGATVRLGNVYVPVRIRSARLALSRSSADISRTASAPTIYGTGRQTRDYVYVSDVIAGLLAVLDHPEVHGEYNIGTGRASSVLDIIKALGPYADRDFAPIFAGRAPARSSAAALTSPVHAQSSAGAPRLTSPTACTRRSTVRGSTACRSPDDINHSPSGGHTHDHISRHRRSRLPRIASM